MSARRSADREALLAALVDRSSDGWSGDACAISPEDATDVCLASVQALRDQLMAATPSRSALLDAADWLDTYDNVPGEEEHEAALKSVATWLRAQANPDTSDRA